MKKNTLWLSFLVLFFSLIFLRAMTFVYVDGDDATSLAYHVLGRDTTLQPPYVPYQGMADATLGLLPPKESLLRLVALLATNFAAVTLVAFLLLLLFSWVRLPAQLPKWLLAAAFIFAVPELSYLGLIYSPTLIAMSFLLAAHLLIRKSYRDARLFGRWKFSEISLFLLSLISFGVGVSFRWNTLLYGGVIFVDLVLLRKKYRDTKLKDFFPSSVWLWGGLALLASLGMIALSGYGFAHFANQLQTVRYVLNQTGTLTPGVKVSFVEGVLRTLLTLTPEFTPAFLFFVILGFIDLLRRKNPLWIVVVVGVLSVLPWLRSGNPKFIITSLPVFALCFVLGFNTLWMWLYSRNWRVFGYLLLVLFFLLPWFLGVRISFPGVAWGPDFSLKNYDYQDIEHTEIAFALGSGMAFPSPEGPRPLWGHAFVLWGGGWREMVTENSLERQLALQDALMLDIPLVVTSWSPDFFVNPLYAAGYTTPNPSQEPRDGYSFSERVFRDGSGSSLTIFSAEFEAQALDKLLSGLKELSTFTDQIVFVGYPNTLRALYLYAPEAFTPIGREAARVDLMVLFHHQETASEGESTSVSSAFTTISPTQSDAYLSNPGIGWQYDVNVNSAYLPETVVYGRRLRIGWSILNPEEGVYNWAPLDEMLSLAILEGKQLSFRVFTMRGGQYGGHMLPDWVLAQGAQILPNGSPDYSNCVYQASWATFVEALIDHYDANQNIAFVDISGYGDFNEWSWQEQTSWSPFWDRDYQEGLATSASFRDVDSQARRRLVDMFIGGSFENHACRNAAGGIDKVSYAYEGFRDMQLVMPYAGINQSTQYVFTRDPKVGFRHDCLGRPNTASIPVTFEKELDVIWRQAPIVYELCPPEQVEWESAKWLLENTHGSIVHNNEYVFGGEKLEELMRNVGYRYFLKEARIQQEALAGANLVVEMDWQNVGLAPSYPMMGQEFGLTLFLEDESGRAVEEFPVELDISAWMPAESPSASAPIYSFSVELPLPVTLRAGRYFLKVSLIEKRTGKPIQLAFEGNDGTGKYFLTEINVE